MTKTIRILSVSLALQLALALVLNFTGPNLAARTDETYLLPANMEIPDHITIEGPDRGRLELLRTNTAWKLPGMGDFPADGGKVTQMLDALKGLKMGLPIAT